MIHNLNPATRASGMTLPIPSTQPLAGMIVVPWRPIPPLMMAANPQMEANRRGKKKERRPSKLGTVKEEFTEVDKNGLPTAPKELVGGYAGQLGCILRGTVSINTENLRHPDRANLRNLLFTKLHNRYKFPAQFANTRLHENKVNSAALTKMSTSLATWRSR